MIVNPYNLSEILTRFTKDVTLKDLQDEVRQYKKEIKDLRQFTSLSFSHLQEQINRIIIQGIIYIYIYISFFINKNALRHFCK